MNTPSTKPARLPTLTLPSNLDPIYINLARIMHSPTEIIFDFARFLPGMASADILSRIIMSPLSAKLFHRALSENIAKYEASFGEISIPGNSSLADQLFGHMPPNSPNKD